MTLPVFKQHIQTPRSQCDCQWDTQINIPRAYRISNTNIGSNTIQIQKGNFHNAQCYLRGYTCLARCGDPLVSPIHVDDVTSLITYRRPISASKHDCAQHAHPVLFSTFLYLGYIIKNIISGAGSTSPGSD